jgi:alpha-beta hydrolase superfamily lysophospholipase
MSRLARILLSVLAIVIAVAGLAWVAGGVLSAPAQRLVGAPPADLGAENVMFPSASGSRIHGWFAPGTPGRGAVLLLHGVRGDRRDMVSRAEFLHRLGYAVLLIDFQAHGESPGDRITFGDRESRDVVAALSYLKQRAPGERLGGARRVFGRGLAGPR